MEKVWKLLSNFEAIETGFWTEFENIKHSLDYIKDIVEVQNEKILSIQKTLICLQGQVELQQEKELCLARACEKGFVQVRDACHVLREDISEASGTLVAETWND